MEDKTVEGICGEIDIFSAPVSQKTILSGDWIQYKTTQAINQESPLIFEINGAGEKYVDTSKTLLLLKLRAYTGDMKPLSDADKFTVANNLGGTLFQECIVEMNQVIVSQSHQLYHIKNYLLNLFNYNDSAKSTHLTAGLWYSDEAGKMDDVESAPAKKRANFLRNGKTLELMCRLSADALNTPQYLLNGVDLRITLRRNPDALIFLAGGLLAPKLIIEDASLYCRKVTLSPSILVAHAKILQTKVAQYHFKRTELVHYTLSQGSHSKSFENLMSGKTPIRILVCFLKNSALVGEYKSNVFNFQHFNLNYLNLSLNGVTVGTKPLAPNFETGEYMVPYLMSFYGTGIGSSDDGNCVSRTDYAQGMTIFAYDLTADLSASEPHWSLPQNGSIRIEVGFSKALETTVSMLCLLEYRETLQIDRSRQVSLTYKGGN